MTLDSLIENKVSSSQIINAYEYCCGNSDIAHQYFGVQWINVPEEMILDVWEKENLKPQPYAQAAISFFRDPILLLHKAYKYNIESISEKLLYRGYKVPEDIIKTVIDSTHNPYIDEHIQTNTETKGHDKKYATITKNLKHRPSVKTIRKSFKIPNYQFIKVLKKYNGIAGVAAKYFYEKSISKSIVIAGWITLKVPFKDVQYSVFLEPENIIKIKDAFEKNGEYFTTTLKFLQDNYFQISDKALGRNLKILDLKPAKRIIKNPVKKTTLSNQDFIDINTKYNGMVGVTLKHEKHISRKELIAAWENLQLQINTVRYSHFLEPENIIKLRTAYNKARGYSVPGSKQLSDERLRISPAELKKYWRIIGLTPKFVHPLKTIESIVLPKSEIMEINKNFHGIISVASKYTGIDKETLMHGCDNLGLPYYAGSYSRFFEPDNIVMIIDALDKSAGLTAALRLLKEYNLPMNKKTLKRCIRILGLKQKKAPPFKFQKQLLKMSSLENYELVLDGLTSCDEIIREAYALSKHKFNNAWQYFYDNYFPITKKHFLMDLQRLSLMKGKEKKSLYKKIILSDDYNKDEYLDDLPEEEIHPEEVLVFVNTAENFEE